MAKTLRFSITITKSNLALIAVAVIACWLAHSRGDTSGYNRAIKDISGVNGDAKQSSAFEAVKGWQKTLGNNDHIFPLF